MRGLVLVASGPFLFALFPCCAGEFGGFGDVAASLTVSVVALGYLPGPLRAVPAGASRRPPIDSMPFLSVASIHRVQQLLFWGAARHWTTSCCPRWHFVPAAETSFDHVA